MRSERKWGDWSKGAELLGQVHVWWGMSYSKYLPLPVLFVLAAGTVSAQGKGRMKVLLQNEGSNAPADTVDMVRSALKLNPLLFLRGEVPIYYERALSSHWSMELAVGFTTRNTLNLPRSHESADAYSAGTKILLRPSFHTGLRYYLTKDLEPEGFYFQGECAYLEYAKKIFVKDEKGQLTD